MRAALASLAFVLSLAACQSTPSAGTPCTRSEDCTSPLVCRFGRCRAECAAQRDCPAPALCLLDAMDRGSCTLSDDPGCDGSAGSCADGLSCIDHACVNPCHALADCPMGSQCVTVGGLARCARADEDAGSDPDGGVACHGPGCDPVVQVVADAVGVCARTMGGLVYCWGAAGYLGRGTITTANCDGANPCGPTPMPVLLDQLGRHDPIDHVTDLAMSNGVVCAISDGRVFCWGGGFASQLGTQIQTGAYAQPVQLEAGGDLDGALHVTVGEYAAAATRASDVIAWGPDDWGEYGSGMGAAHMFGVPAPAIHPTALVRFAAATACALEDGAVTCWGANTDGEAGQPTVGAGAIVDMPTTIPGLPTDSPVVSLAPARTHVCVVLQNGDAWCWGDRPALGVRAAPAGCQMGISRLTCPPTRVARAGMSYASLATGPFTDMACAIDTDGAVWCWGEDDASILATQSNGEPVQVEGFPPIASMTIASHFGCAVDHDGEVWCWGSNSLGELGLGAPDATVHTTPARVNWTP